jgi:small subunit ribosomal protein S3
MARGAHKVHPIGFRLGVNKNWKSRWFRDKKDYATTFLNDKKLRDLVSEKLKTAGVADVIIKRSVNRVVVDIHVSKPGVVIGKGGEAINLLKKELEKVAGTDVEPKIFEVKNPEIVAKLVAENIAMQCERRVAPKLAADRAVKALMESNKAQGIAIWIGGRIRGAEMARVEKAAWGVVPRHTLRKDIDYGFAEAQVPGAGKHGIKVWINRGEKNTYNLD